MFGKLAYSALYLVVFLAVIYGSRLLERKWPIATIPRSEYRDDWLAVIVSKSPIATQPDNNISAVAIMGYTGFGWVRLPTDGYWVISPLQ